MSSKRFRIRQEFWLDVNKPRGLELAELIDELKQGRVYSQAIRDGLRLIADLWRGRVDVLLELFPWVEAAFYDRFLEQQPASESALTRQLARLEQLLVEQGSVPVSSVTSPATGGPKALTVPAVAAPAFDDDGPDLLPIRKAKSSGQAAQNFLDSAFALQN